MRQIVITFVCSISLSPSFAHAIDRVDVAIGNITRPSDTSPIFNSYRLGLTWNTDYFQYSNNFFQQSLRIETSTGFNKAESVNVHDFVIAPVLHYQFDTFYGKPFAEISLGAAYISDTVWAPYHDLNSDVLFADRIGLGYTIAETEISLNYFHFSNGGIKRPNPGADMVLIRASFKL